MKITPMPVPGSPGDKGPAGEAWVDAGANQMNLNSPTYLASSGWDWMPAVRDRAAGIWNHVRLRSTGHVVIGDPRVDTLLPNLPDVSVAELTIVVPVRNADTADHRATVSAAFDGVRVSKVVTVPAGESLDVTFTPDAFGQLRLRNPKLWWPNGLGDPALHDLTLVASVDGAESDRRTTRFGIRQFGYEYEVPLPFTASGDAYTQSVTFDRQQARYVRIKCLTRASGWGNSLWTLAVSDSARPSVDLALHAPADASSKDGDDHGPANVTDGDPATRWSSAYEDDQWIRVDLGSSQSFDRVDLTWEQAYAKTYVVQVSSDDADWTDVASVDNSAVPLPFNNGNASLQVEEFAARTARYVRIACGVRNTSWGNSLWSLGVIDSAKPGTDLALRQKATASTEESDHPAAHATDGDTGTRWSSQYEDQQWIQVDLGAAKRFDRVAIVWEPAYPKTYVIQVSDDGDTWTDVKSVSNTPDPLKISVNGVRVLARGGNWGWDELLRRMPPERMDAAVRMHRDMNFTMIRNWVGTCDREEFFAACDEHGILVWNDFPNAWAMDPPDHDAFNSIARDTVLRYRIHPSVVIWCGANEGNPPAAIDKGMRQAVEQQAPGILYQNNSAGGIITGGGPYGWVEPEKYFDPSTYGSKDFGFHTEIGMPVVSTAASIRNMTGDEPEWPIRGAWYYHDWSERGNQAPHTYKAAVEARLGETEDLDDFARKAQFVNYENTRAMFEAWNANLWDNASGLMLWMSHPAWHSTVWQTYDYDFDVNGTYYGARTACEPLHVQADPKGQVLAVNHTRKDLKNATVSARLFDLSGRQLGKTQEHTAGRCARRHREGVHQRLDRRPARPPPAAPDAGEQRRPRPVEQHLLAPSHRGSHAGVDQGAADQGVRNGDAPVPVRGPSRTDRHHPQPRSVRRRHGPAVPAQRQDRPPRSADALQRQLPVAAPRRVTDRHLVLARPGPALAQPAPEGGGVQQPLCDSAPVGSCPTAPRPGQRGLSRVCRRQNSLPSGSARTCQFSAPVWPTSAGLAPRASNRSSSASWSRSVALTSMCSGSFPLRGSLLGLRTRVGCGPPKPTSGGPISMLPSSSRSSST